MMSIVSFFDIDATLTESDVEILDGVKFNRISVRSGEGKLFSILLYPSTQTPRRISGELNSLPCTLEILSFEFLQ